MPNIFSPNYFYSVNVPGTGRSAKFGRTTLLYFKIRNGNEIVFQTHDKRQFTGKALTNVKTGDEVCHLIIDGIKHLVEASKGHSRGQRITEETLHARVDYEWNDDKQRFVKTEDCGMPLKDFLAKKADQQKAKQKE
jgi:hypothetical protein